MKSLKTIQKTFHVFQILSKVAMILSFVGAGLAGAALLGCVVFHFGGSIIGLDPEVLISMTETESLTKAIGVLLIDTILALTDGILLAFALRYFNSEQADGTPFTRSGAERIMRLGVLTIALPLVAAIPSAIVCEIMKLPADIVRNWDNRNGLATGIVLILASLIFRYGAELEAVRGSDRTEKSDS